MTALNLKLPPHVYRRLREEAARLGKSPQVVAQEWIVERLTPPSTAPSTDRERARQALRAAGLLTELGPNLQARRPNGAPGRRQGCSEPSRG